MIVSQAVPGEDSGSWTGYCEADVSTNKTVVTSAHHLQGH